MILRILLQNFQSHNLTEIHFSKGINAIIGVSDKGKSVLMRGAEWVRTNRPVGEAHISDWAYNEKGKQVEPCRVVIENEHHTVERVRDAKVNSYLVDGTLAEAVGTEVPDAVSQALNLGDLNIQKQLDGPFLLSQNGGDNARFFNSLVNLEEIDRCMSAADSLRRENNRDIATHTKELETSQALIASYSWVDRCRERIEKIRGIQGERALIQTRLEFIRDLATTRKIHRNTMRSLSWVTAAEESIRRIQRLEGEHATKYDRRRDIRSLCEVRYQHLREVRRGETLPRASDTLVRLRDAVRGVSGISTRLNQISELLERRKLAAATIAKAGPLEGALVSVEVLQGLLDERSEVESRLAAVKDCLRRRRHNSELVSELRKASTIDLGKLRRFVSMRSDKESRRSEISSAIRRRSTLVAQRDQARASVETLSLQLPETCPTCGKPYRSAS